MTKGDIVLLRFPFTDLSGSKPRPAVILSEQVLDITACFITAQINYKETADIELTPSYNNGLKRLSPVRVSKIATLDKSLATGRLGMLDKSEIIQLDKSLKLLFQLA